MLSFAYYLFKVLICSGVLYGYYLFALRNKRFHQYNRLYLLSAVALSFVIPFIEIEFWKEEVQPSVVMKAITIVNYADVYVSNQTSVWNWNNIAFAAFGCISLVFLLSLIGSLIKIFILIKKYPKKFWENVCFVFSNTPGTPFSFFKYIFWNNQIDINTKKGKHILQHELTHVHQKHSADKLFLNIVLVAGWANPFFWLIREELNIIHEFIADQKAISSGDPDAFATMLLSAAYPQHGSMLTNSFFHSPIKRRLLMLTTSKLPSYSYLRRLMILPLLLIVTILFAFKVKEKIDGTNNKTVAVIVNANHPKTIANGTSEIVDNDEQEEEITAAKNLQDTGLKKNKGVVEVPEGANIKITDPSGLVIEVPKHASKSNAIYRDSLKYKYRDVLVVLDGELMTYEELGEKNIEAEQIKQIDVLKGKSALDKYGEKGHSGVIEITTVSSAFIGSDPKLKSEQQYLQLHKQQQLKQQQSQQLYQQEKLKQQESQQLYEQGRQKQLHNQQQLQQQPLSSLPQSRKDEQDHEKIFTKVQQPAQFPGGPEAWRRYLLRNANLNIYLSKMHQLEHIP